MCRGHGEGGLYQGNQSVPKDPLPDLQVPLARMCSRSSTGDPSIPRPGSPLPPRNVSAQISSEHKLSLRDGTYGFYR